MLQLDSSLPPLHVFLVNTRRRWRRVPATFLPRSRSRLHRWLLSDQIKPASTSTVHTLKQAIKDTILRHIKIILPLLWWYMKTMSRFTALVPSARFCHPPALYFWSSFRPTSFRLRGWQAEELRTNSICLSVRVCLGKRRDAARGWSSLLSGFLPSGTLTLITNRHTLTRLCQTCVLREPPPSSLSPCLHPLFPSLSSSLRLCWGFNLKADLSGWCRLMD